MAACAAAIKAGASPEQIAASIPQFTGAGRRFEILGNVGGVTIADDYAHHPAELTATLTAATKMGFQEVWAVFQPFTYSRTAMLLDDFAKALSIADRVVLSEIMGSREKNTYNIYSRDLADKIDGCVWFDAFPGDQRLCDGKGRRRRSCDYPGLRRHLQSCQADAKARIDSKQKPPRHSRGGFCVPNERAAMPIYSPRASRIPDTVGVFTSSAYSRS